MEYGLHVLVIASYSGQYCNFDDEYQIEIEIDRSLREQYCAAAFGKEDENVDSSQQKKSQTSHGDTTAELDMLRIHLRFILSTLASKTEPRGLDWFCLTTKCKTVHGVFIASLHETRS